MHTLTGKRVLITGASSGIGLGISKVFAREGAELFLTALGDPGTLNSVAEALRSGGVEVHSACFDLRDPQQIDQLFQKVAEAFPTLDVLVNNAGTTERRRAEDIDVEHFDRIIETNLRAPILCALRAAKLMKNGGKILNISSFQAASPTPHSLVYASSKAALNSVTRSLALEFAHQNIQVNSLSPGWIIVESDPPMTLEEEALYSSFIPFGRLGKVNDVAEMAAFLASERSQFTTGSEIVIDGGQSVPLHFPKRSESSSLA